VSFAILGPEEVSTGDAARRLNIRATSDTPDVIMMD